MSRASNIARYADWSHRGIGEYLGLYAGVASTYALGRDFYPGTLGRVCPKQLHETAIHADGHYVHIEGGTPALKRNIEALTEEIPRWIITDAIEWMATNAGDKGRRAAEFVRACQHKTAMDTWDGVMSKLDITEASIGRRRNRAEALISWYLDQHYAGLFPSTSA